MNHFFVFARCISALLYLFSTVQASATMRAALHASVADTISVYGTNFLPNAQVQLNGATLQTIYVSATELKAVVPTGTPFGSYPVSVFNPGGGVSSSQTIAISCANASRLAMQYRYTTKETSFQMIDSSSGSPTISPLDTALLWSLMIPHITRTAIRTDIDTSGHFEMTIDDFSEPVGTLAPQPKNIVVRSEDSTVTTRGPSGEVMSVLKMAGIESFKPLVDSLRRLPTPPVFMGGVVGGMPNTLSMSDYIALMKTRGADTASVGGNRTRVTLRAAQAGTGSRIPDNATVIATINRSNNTLESLTLHISGQPPVLTKYYYDTIANAPVLQGTITEMNYTTDAGTTMKSVHITEYERLEFSNYIRQ